MANKKYNRITISLTDGELSRFLEAIGLDVFDTSYTETTVHAIYQQLEELFKKQYPQVAESTRKPKKDDFFKDEQDFYNQVYNYLNRQVLGEFLELLVQHPSWSYEKTGDYIWRKKREDIQQRALALAYNDVMHRILEYKILNGQQPYGDIIPKP